MLSLDKRLILSVGIPLVLALSGCNSGASDSADPLDPASGTGQEDSVDPVAEPGGDAVVVPPVVDAPVVADPTVDDPIVVNPTVDPVGSDPSVDDPVVADPVEDSVSDPVVVVPSVDPIDDPGMADPVEPVVNPDSAPVVVSSRTPFDLIAELPFDNTVFFGGSSITPFAITADGSRVLIKESFDDATDNFVSRFLSLDVSTNSASLLPFTPIDDAFPAFDDAFNTMAYATPCTASIQRPGQFSEPLILGAELTELCTSRQSAEISDDGETLLMPSFGNDGGGSVAVILGVSSGSVMTLDNTTLQRADSALTGRTATALDPGLSADGRYVVATVIVADEPLFTNGQALEFSAGTVIADTATGDVRVIGLSDYERFTCRGCNAIPPVPAPAISGNGQFVVYAQAPEIQNPGEPAVEDSLLFRYNIDTGETQQIFSGPVGASEIVLSDSGTRAAFRVAGDVQVAYIDSDEILPLKEAFNFCNSDGDDCLFASARFVTSTVLEMSGDGSALTIYLILQEATNASPQDLVELLHFDLDTGILSRVSPGADGLFASLSDDGDTVALIGVDDGRDETIAVFRSGRAQ